MKRHFTQAEVYYLNTLPAVERASMDRITYFKGIPSALHGAILTGQRADQHLRQRRS